jgi:hypothetical protein
MISLGIPIMRRVLAARGTRAQYNRLAVGQWIADSHRKPQVAEARRLGLTPRHFRRIVHELQADISNFVSP